MLPWQRYVADVAGELDSNGQLVYDDVTVVLPRQQGKTEMILPEMTHRCTAYPNQRVVYTTQTADKAREKFRDVHVFRLQQSIFASLFTPRLRQNMEAIMWKNGSFWVPSSTTGKTGGTGDSIDMAVIDEMWSRPDARTELGIRPAMLTRANRQLWRLSMVPGLARLKDHNPAYMRDQMEKGRDRVARGVIRSQCYFEWSADRDSDPADPRTWRTCLPGLQCHGGLIPESAIHSDFDSGLTLVDFCAEYLGWPVDDHKPKWVVIAKRVWDGLGQNQGESEISGGLAFGIEVSPDRLRAYIGVAGARRDDNYHVEIIEPGGIIPLTVRGIDWLEDRVVDLVNKHDPCAVLIAGNSPAASLIVPLRNRGIEITVVSAQQMAAATGAFFDATGQTATEEDDGLLRRVYHLKGQAVLDRAVAYARTTSSPTTGSFSWLRVGAVDISPLVAVTLALYGYELNRPDDYDLADSVPFEGQCESCYACPVNGWTDHYPDCETLR